MAMQFHPDKNPESVYAAAHFKEINEAYNILSNIKSREKYDEDRWLSGMSKHVYEEPMLHAAAIYKKCEQLRRHMDSLDMHTMDHAALQAYILLLLNDERMNILKRENNGLENEAIVKVILTCIQKLRIIHIAAIIERLNEIAVGHKPMENEILDFVKKRNRQHKLDAALPFMIILISVLLTWAMYRYGLKH